jgi:radical SAM protein with 4Fe4S-binding SPASM domain
MKLTIKDCKHPWNYLQILANGDVRPCCWASDIVGNLIESTMDEIWNGETMEDLRKCVMNGETHRLCKNSPCPYVQGSDIKGRDK